MLDALLESKRRIHRLRTGDRVEGAEPVELVVIEQVEALDRRTRMLAAPNGTAVPAVHLARKRMPTGRQDFSFAAILAPRLRHTGRQAIAIQSRNHAAAPHGEAPGAQER